MKSEPVFLRDVLRQEAGALSRKHRPPSSVGEWLKQRKSLRRQLFSAIGSFPRPLGLDIQSHGMLRMDGYRICKLTYQSRSDLRVTANLFIPDGKGPFPAVLNVHGHLLQGKIAPEVAARGHILAKEGIVTLSVDAIGAGERGTLPGIFEYHGNQQGAALLSISETLLGMQLYDNMRGIDLLQSLDYVDGDKIGVTGESGGGNQTMWLSALDARVKASVPVVSAGTFQAFVTNANCWCETLPDGLKIAEEWAVLGMVAPNPLLLLTAVHEKIPAFLFHEAARTYKSARRIYRLMDVESQIALRSVDAAHGYFPEMQRHMVGWFRKWLLGVGSGEPTDVPAVRDLPESRLMCFQKTNRPPVVKSLIEYVSLRSNVIKAELLAAPTLNRSKKRRDLARILRIPAPGIIPAIDSVVEGVERGCRAEKFTLESEPGILIPCVLIVPGGRQLSTIVIASHPEGNDAALKQPESMKALQEGKAVCLVDLRETGKTAWDPPVSQCRNAARAALWLGRTMIGNWVHDLCAVRTALARRRPRVRFELLGFRETALAALAAAVIRRGFAQVSSVEMLSSYVLCGAPPVQTFSIFVPGLLTWGDVSLMAAMVACPLKVTSLVHPSGLALSKQETSTWSREVRKLRDALRVDLQTCE